MPIDTRQEIFYFEAKILNTGTRNLIMIGISDRDFQLNKQLGTTKKSYGYKADGKVYNGKNTGEEYGPKFERCDIVGCGLIMSRKQIFFTINGRFLGTAFSNIDTKEQLFPSVCLQSINEEVVANFSGQKSEQFVFDLEGFKNDLAQAEFIEISKVKIKKHSLNELVKSYLIHYAFVETLQAIEEETSSSDQASLQVLQSQAQTQMDEEQKDDNSENKKERVSFNIDLTQLQQKMSLDEKTFGELQIGRETSAISDVSIEEQIKEQLLRTTRAESVNIFDNMADQNLKTSSQTLQGIQRRLNRSGSQYVPPRISEFVIEKSEKFIKNDSAVHLKERGQLRYMIQSGEVTEARKLLEEKFQVLYKTNHKIQAYLDALEFINFIAEGDLEKAIEFSVLTLHKYQDPNRRVKIPSKNTKNQEIEIEVKEVTALLCYEDPFNSELAYLLGDGQRQMLADKINNEILSKYISFNFLIEFGNKNKRKNEEPSSQLENVFKQLQLCQETLYRKNNEKFLRMADFMNIGEQFVNHYYNVFDTSRPNLKELYSEESMLTFEGEQFRGVAAIIDKFSSFGNIKHVIKSFDAQPTVNSGILCFISGDLFIDGSENPVKFAQVFQLFPGGTAGYFCYNDMFRLNYG